LRFFQFVSLFYWRTLLLSAAFFAGSAVLAHAEDDNENTTPTGWWIYAGQSVNDINSTLRSDNARIIDIAADDTSFSSFTVTYVQNTGSYAKQWWWYYNVDPSFISNAISSNKARLLDLTPAGNGNFNVTMESCSTGCPAWWWYYGLTGSQVLTEARNNGARAITFEPFSGGGSSSCFATLLISNTPADVTACDPQGCISEAKLQTNICRKLANRKRFADPTSMWGVGVWEADAL
jgi:hypothetical protein